MPGIQTILDLRMVFGIALIYDANQAPNQPFEAEVKLNPGGKSAIHIHPEQEEFYKVREGELEILLNGKWKKLVQGEELLINKGAVHAFRNEGTQKVVVINKHIPGLRTREYFETMQKLILQRKITGTTGFKNSIYLSLHAMKFRDVVVLVRTRKVLVQVAAFAGKILGYKI